MRKIAAMTASGIELKYNDLLVRFVNLNREIGVLPIYRRSITLSSSQHLRNTQTQA